MSSRSITASSQPRQRMSRENRLAQLLTVACQIIREEGTEALTLGHLAQMAEVTKPVVYDHFATRPALLAKLYQEFDAKQTARMDEALRDSAETIEAKAKVIASSYVDCVQLQGRQIPGVIAALSSSPELAKIKREYEGVFMEKCRKVLAPLLSGGEISLAKLRAMLGAAESLSDAAAGGEISSEHAREELYQVIISMVDRARL